MVGYWWDSQRQFLLLEERVFCHWALFVCLDLHRFNHELVFGVSVKNLSKAERLIYGDSLMTHAMILTAVTDKVWIHEYDICTCAHTVFFMYINDNNGGTVHSHNGLAPRIFARKKLSINKRLVAVISWHWSFSTQWWVLVYLLGSRFEALGQMSVVVPGRMVAFVCRVHGGKVTNTDRVPMNFSHWRWCIWVRQRHGRQCTAVT